MKEIYSLAVLAVIGFIAYFIYKRSNPFKTVAATTETKSNYTAPGYIEYNWTGGATIAQFVSAGPAVNDGGEFASELAYDTYLASFAPEYANHVAKGIEANGGF